jgi:phosphoglycerate dehydrogenase-like enzyme
MTSTSSNMPIRKGTVFIASDPQLAHALEEIALQLGKCGHEVILGPDAKPPEKTRFAKANWERDFSHTEIILTTTRSIFTRELMEAASRLRGIVFLTSGTESVDLEAANALGIAIGHGPFPENYSSMAEATIMLMLNLMYDLRRSEDVLRNNRPRPTSVRARLMQGRTVGLIGLGRIARGVADRLAGWDMRVLAYVTRAPATPVPNNVELVALATLLNEADLVSIHASLNAQNRHLIGKPELELMKSSAYLINTARGGLVDEHALYQALKDKRIAGAAIDSFELEPLPQDSELRLLENLILTPHMVGHTQDGLDAVPRTAMENISRIVRGEPPLYCRNPEVLPRWMQRIKMLDGAITE